MKVGTGSGMTDEDKMQRAVALRAIAEQTKHKVNFFPKKISENIF